MRFAIDGAAPVAPSNPTVEVSVERRDFLKGAAVAGIGAAASTLAAPAIAQGKRELKMVM
jgi:hypothetical protein